LAEDLAQEAFTRCSSVGTGWARSRPRGVPTPDRDEPVQQPVPAHPGCPQSRGRGRPRV